MLLSALFLYSALAACAVIVGWLVVRYDLHEREPLPLLAAAMLLGAGAMFAAGRLQVWALTAAHAGNWEIGNASHALLAGTTEELAKFAVVAAIALCCRRRFNEPVDGLIYGSFAGLGAALEESVAVMSDSMPLAFLPMQEPVRLTGHLVMGGIGGFGVGLLVLRARIGPSGVVLCLLGAIVLHTLWDVVAFDAADFHRHAGRVHAWHTGSAIVLMLGGMVVYRGMVSAGVRMAQTHGPPRANEENG